MSIDDYHSFDDDTSWDADSDDDGTLSDGEREAQRYADGKRGQPIPKRNSTKKVIPMSDSTAAPVEFTQPGNIHIATLQMRAAIAAAGGIAKTRESTGTGSFKFRGVDDTYNKLAPMFPHFGINPTPKWSHELEWTEYHTKSGSDMTHVVVRGTLELVYAYDPSSVISLTLIGEAADAGDKVIGKAQSYAMKKALLDFFTIPTEGDNDPDAKNHEREGPRVKRGSTPAKASEPSEEDVHNLQTWNDRWSSVESPEDYNAACEEWKSAPQVVRSNAEVKTAMFDASKRASATAKKRKEEKAKDDKPADGWPNHDLEARVSELVTLYKSIPAKGGKTKLADLDAQLAKEHAAVRNSSAVMAAQADAVARVTGGA